MGGRAKEREAAATSDPDQHAGGRFETEILTTRKKPKPSMDVPEKWIDRVRQHGAFDKLILDLDNSASETYGHRERRRSLVAYAIVRWITLHLLSHPDCWEKKPPAHPG